MAYTPTAQEIMANLAPPPDPEQRLLSLLDRLEKAVEAIEARSKPKAEPKPEPKTETTPPAK
jgi:hypothetical protein